MPNLSVILAKAAVTHWHCSPFRMSMPCLVMKNCRPSIMSMLTCIATRSRGIVCYHYRCSADCSCCNTVKEHPAASRQSSNQQAPGNSRQAECLWCAWLGAAWTGGAGAKHQLWLKWSNALVLLLPGTRHPSVGSGQLAKGNGQWKASRGHPAATTTTFAVPTAMLCP